MTPSVALRPRARDDIEDIWDYTAKRWGVAQAETYVRSLWHDFVLIEANPSIGRLCPEIRKDYRKRACGSHVIFYRNIDTGVEIIRILHTRMDVRRHVY